MIPAERHRIIAERVIRDGEDLNVVGADYGITRSRVQQLVHKHCRLLDPTYYRVCEDRNLAGVPTIAMLRDRREMLFGGGKCRR